MAKFLAVAGVHNLTPPKRHLHIHNFDLEKSPQLTLDEARLGRLVVAWNPILRGELMWVLPLLREMTADCILRLRFDATNLGKAMDRARQEFQKIALAIELITVKVATLSGPAVGPEDAGGRFVFLSPKRQYRGGRASIQAEHVTVLKEIMTTLDTKPTTRIEIALLEFDTALKSGDVRRQLIHAVVALEALFGDAATEALRYKVPLRAVQIIPSLKKKREKAFKQLQTAYDLRSKFVHGAWNRKMVREAEGLIDELLALAAEGVLEFLFRIEDQRPTDFPGLDAELFLS
jgi:hypothetical protein